MLNNNIFKDIQSFSKKILVVTKYRDETITKEIINICEEKYSDILYGIGENRIEAIIEKNIPREKIHFIGNIQSKKIGKIVKHCSVIHSLCSLEHARKIESQGLETSIFIQICLDKQKNIGISSEELSSFLESCNDFKYLKIIGISAIGAGSFDEDEKKKEFEKLIFLRDKYLPKGLISAGTSRDYDLAIEMGIDVVRVGKAIMEF